MIVKTPNELLAPQDRTGAIEVNHDLQIECHIPWSVGKDISSLRVSGNLDVKKYMRLGGDLNVSDGLEISAPVYIENELHVGVDLNAFDSLEVGGSLNVFGHIYIDGNLHVGENIYTYGELHIEGTTFYCKDLYWPHAHKPTLPDKTFIHRILPFPTQRNHWQKRLGIEFPEWSCYDEICETVLPEIPRLLRSNKWNETERWILETLRDN